MNRPSSISTRPSGTGALGAGSLGSRPALSATSIQTRILEKRQEWEAVSSLTDTTAEIAAFLEEIAVASNTMADGAQTIAAVMANWPNILRVISLFVRDAHGTFALERPSGPAAHSNANIGETLPRLVRATSLLYRRWIVSTLVKVAYSFRWKVL